MSQISCTSIQKKDVFLFGGLFMWQKIIFVLNKKFLFCALIFNNLKTSARPNSPFYQVVKDAEIVTQAYDKIFILPVKIDQILKFSSDSRIFFSLCEETMILSILDGVVIKIDTKLQYIKIKGSHKKQVLLVRYFGLDQILVQVGSKVRKGQKIGHSLGYFSMQVRVNDVIVNLFDYIELTKEERKKLDIKK